MRKVFCTRERRKTSNVEDARHDGTLLEWGMFRMERADAEMPAMVRAKFSACSTQLSPTARKISGKNELALIYCQVGKLIFSIQEWVHLETVFR